MISFHSAMFTLVLLCELSAHTVCQGEPTGKLEEAWMERQNLNSMLDDEAMAEPSLHVPAYRQSSIQDNRLEDEDGTPKIIVLSDIGLKRHSRRGLNSARAPPLLTERSTDQTPAEYNLRIERREADLDMLRCMIGRVYRPCWQS
ncbi:pro-MCH [Osmerus mordax]|uniref:pro-MCH n=1 Tax=Osmerus mordax TaxID=8014 RepID=UPI00350ECE0F